MHLLSREIGRNLIKYRWPIITYSHVTMAINYSHSAALSFFLTHFYDPLYCPLTTHIQQWVQLWESTAGLRGNQTSQLECVLASPLCGAVDAVNVVRSPYRSWAHSSFVSLLCTVASILSNSSTFTFFS